MLLIFIKIMVTLAFGFLVAALAPSIKRDIEKQEYWIAGYGICVSILTITGIVAFWFARFP